ncbi:pyrroline-5-carboxylate reductase [bacterium]|nr:pyrroline-5-carboxylate reductase [bacterium]
MAAYQKKIAFVGGGNMAEAVFSGLIGKETVMPKDILVCEKRAERREYLEEKYQIETTEDNSQASRQATTVFLSVKPQILMEVQKPVRDHLTPEHIVISILAGTGLAKLESALGHPERTIRVMPNLPALVGRGVSAITFPNILAEPEREWVRSILRSVGEVVEVDEPLQDVVTAVSGSGPGYIFYFAQFFIEAAITQGLTEEVATRLVTETLGGAAELLKQGSDTAETLVGKVATPGGTTEAGLSVLKESDLPIILNKMVERAADRSRQLNKG